MLDLVALKVNLQGQQQGEGQFVGLIQTTHSVAEDLIRHVLNDVLDSLLGDRRLLRSGKSEGHKGWMINDNNGYPECLTYTGV